MSDVPRRPARLDISRATLDDWPVIRGWAADEGWNPGLADGVSFFAQDPDGFFLGRIDGEPVSAVSVVNYGDDYAFLGCYLVRPDLRGRGHGIATWKAGLTHAGGRTVGLDGVVAQQGNYRKSGFELAHRTIRFTGIAAGGTAAPADGVVPVDGDLAPLLAPLLAYDSACYPADRPRFLESWLTTEGHVVRARVVGGRVTGYGVLREGRDMPRIGPLFADTPDDARVLFDALAPAGRPVGLDVPASNRAAVALAEGRGLEPGFETARMYTGPVRAFAEERVFGVTTLELG
ncbi:GNAT family N-acetyltransferase [Streptomyces endophyticus]|uniref:GNAT family N-acetyltransferase n=1 Tax=Streptomyces endophyticus TaxID=714166 RepID=A0ABU6F8E8_9ACTN|nr:GNAT family N-acetyltransferase [Streptomyces endophyticus]MEB8340299.1 GNAT family N-acetyltransferase [Streptomyces endophyticus]